MVLERKTAAVTGLVTTSYSRLGRPARVVDNEIHPLVASWIDIVEDSGDLHSDRLPAAANHFGQARDQPVVGAVGKITIESALLGMDYIYMYIHIHIQIILILK